jgi:tetratricopeptide (TPR) repeat protein
MHYRPILGGASSTKQYQFISVRLKKNRIGFSGKEIKMNGKNIRLIIVLLACIIFAPGIVKSQEKTDEQLALQYYSDKDYGKAIVFYEKLFDDNPNLLNYTYYLNCLLELEKFSGAEKVAKKQMKAFPSDPRYQVDLGYVYIRENENQKGRKQYEECLKDLPADQRHVQELAGAFLTRRETDYAVKTYQKGKELLGGSYTFGMELASLYQSTGNFGNMINEYLDLLLHDDTQVPYVQSQFQTFLGDDADNTRHDLFRTTLLKKNQQNPDLTIYSELLLWYSMQEKDFAQAFIQAKALDRRLNEGGQRLFNLARLSASNKDFDVAIEAYNYVIKKAKDPDLLLTSRVELLNTEFQKTTSTQGYKTETIRELGNKYRAALTELGRNVQTVPLVRDLAHIEAFYLDHSDSAIAMLDRVIAMKNIPLSVLCESKLELADILLFSGDPWEATLLYSQVEKSFKNEPLGHEAKFRNAKLSFYIGEFEWAKTQLDILKAATSKLIANDAMALSLLISDNTDPDSSTVALGIYARADLLLFRNQDAKAIQTLDSIAIRFPGHSLSDDVLFKKAEISVKDGDYLNAAIYWKKVADDFPDDVLADDALFRLAGLYETVLNDKAKAMELYQNLMEKYPASVFVTDARKRFRILRNDPVN